MARSDKPFEVTGGGGGALTNKQAADMIRKLTRIVQGRKINPSLMRERPGGAVLHLEVEVQVQLKQHV